MPNSFEVSGEVKFPPDLHTTATGKNVANVLITHKHEKFEKKSDFRIVGWGFMADKITALSVGDVVTVKGELHHNRYEKDGQWVDKGVQLNADWVEKFGSNRQESQQPAQELPVEQVAVPVASAADDDIPF